MTHTTCPTTAHRIPNLFGLNRAVLGFLFVLFLFACTDSKPPEMVETDLDLAYAAFADRSALGGEPFLAPLPDAILSLFRKGVSCREA